MSGAGRSTEEVLLIQPVPADRRLACAPLGSTGCICYLKYLGPEVYQIRDLWDLGTFI